MWCIYNYIVTLYHREDVCVSGQCAVHNNPGIPAYFFQQVRNLSQSRYVPKNVHTLLLSDSQ